MDRVLRSGRRLLPQVAEDGYAPVEVTDVDDQCDPLPTEFRKRCLPCWRQLARLRGLCETLLVCLLFLWAIGCAGLQRPPASQLEPPSTDAILRLVGRFGAAHACPISATLALTSAHVTDLRPFDASTALYPLNWSDGFGHEGTLTPMWTVLNRDLALMESRAPLASWYPIATERPAPGDRLLTLGYDFRTRRDMYAPRLFDLKVLRIVARNVITEPGIERGSSGACVLNSRGEVVAVNAWRAEAEDGSGAAGAAVGVWGERFER